jgi:aspartate/glutamate racemase
VKGLGLVGGIAPPSTAGDDGRLIARSPERSGGRAYPEVVVDSIDLKGPRCRRSTTRCG